MVRSTTFGSPTVSGISGPSLGDFGKSVVKNSILDLGVAGGVAIGASADSAVWFPDGGVLTGLGADIGKKVATDMGNILTEDNSTPLDRIPNFGDPISVFA